TVAPFALCRPSTTPNVDVSTQAVSSSKSASREPGTGAKCHLDRAARGQYSAPSAKPFGKRKLRVSSFSQFISAFQFVKEECMRVLVGWVLALSLVASPALAAGNGDADSTGAATSNGA